LAVGCREREREKERASCLLLWLGELDRCHRELHQFSYTREKNQLTVMCGLFRLIII
jgi:hypothetical protein